MNATFHGILVSVLGCHEGLPRVFLVKGDRSTERRVIGRKATTNSAGFITMCKRPVRA